MRIQRGIDMQGGMISAQLRSPIHGKKNRRKKPRIWINKSGAFSKLASPEICIRMYSLWHPRIRSKKYERRRRQKLAGKAIFLIKQLLTNVRRTHSSAHEAVAD